MRKIHEYTIKGNYIEVIEESDCFYAYNLSNDKLIKTNKNGVEFLNKTIDVENPLSNFVNDTYQKRITDYHLFRFKKKVGSMKCLIKFTDFIYKKKIIASILILNILILLSLCTYGIGFLENSIVSLSNQNIVFLILCGLFITGLHELGHYGVYYKYTNSKLLSLGVCIRYFSLLLLFTKVPFFHILSKKEKIRLIVAGIYVQSICAVVLGIIALSLKNSFFLILYLQNLGFMVINSIPFIRLDGYWLLNVLMGEKDYMKTYSRMLKKEVKIKWEIILLGSLNRLVTVFFFLFFVYRILLWILTTFS